MDRPNDDARLTLGSITTIPEICRAWGKDRKVVLMNVYRGNFYAQKISGTWIVFLPDVVARWGLPKNEVTRG